MQMNYGEKLFQLRNRYGKTNIDMANILKISDSLYSRYEKEEQPIPIKHLNTLCNYFHVSLDYIFNLNNVKLYKDEHQEINYKLQQLRLKELRKKHNLTQEKLAKIINVASSTISDYKIFEKPIATPFLYDICKKYNISADYLLGKTDRPKYLN